MPFLFDGYNLYHAACKFSAEFAHLTPMALCRFIAADMYLLKDKAVVVFDGRALRGISQKMEPAGYVKIIYSGPDADADTVMEGLIQKNTAPRRLTVVSSDNRVRKAARRRRTKMLKSLEYLEAFIKRLEKPTPRPTEPQAKRRGLAEGELDEWLELFGLKDKP
jgi:predicted RNA-binding protein with PIN domain